ncbi:MAG: type II secretion system F family protein [Candidatus Eremiobacteraeota bacterium]|nr:type II secretion system F family protein [Candidatus Eremiobacteraeota bacterium]
MQSFHYRCQDQTGEVRDGLVDAKSELVARETLQARGWKVVKLKSVQGAPTLSARPSPDPEPPPGRPLALKDRSLLYLKLSVLTQSGVHILEALEVAARGERPAVAELYDRMATLVASGHYLSQAMARSEAFPESQVSLIRLGEESGKLVGVLARLATTCREQQRRRDQLVASLTYPLFLLGAVGSMILLLVGYLVPRVNALIANMGLEMPAFTRVVVGLFEPHRLAVALIFGLLMSALALAAWFSPVGPALRHKLLFESPLKPVAARLLLIDFARNLALLLEVGFDWDRAVVLSKSGFEGFDRHLDRFRSDLKNHDLPRAIAACELFPPVLKGLLETGYESNRIGQFLTLYANLADEEFQLLVEQFFQLFEPLVLLILGAIVGAIVTASFLPMMAMLTQL